MFVSPAYELGGLLKRNCDSSIPLKDEFAFVFAQDCTRSTFSPKDQAERTEKQRIAALKEDSLLDHALFYVLQKHPLTRLPGIVSVSHGWHYKHHCSHHNKKGKKR